MTFPEQLQTARLTLRRLSVHDAEDLHEALVSSTEHLRPWLPWAKNEPQGIHVRRKFIERGIADFSAGRAGAYAIVMRGEHGLAGAAGIHRRVGCGAGEIGYWVRHDRIRRGIATEAAEALTSLGFDELGLSRMEIHCDVRNTASAAVAAKLGYRLQAIVKARVSHALQDPYDCMIWARSIQPGRAGAAM